MTTICRPTTVDDEERLTEFLTRVFATDRKANFVNPAMLRWKYWDQRQDCPEPRSFVMERDGKIVAHVGLWPVKVQTGTKVERGIHAMDWAADPEARGAGVTLFVSLTKSYDFVYGMGGSEMTRSILPKLGFRAVAEATTWARPIRPWRQLFHHQNRDLRLPLRFVRNLYWSKMPPILIPSGYAAVEINSSGAEELLSISSERDEAFFRYLRQCPVARSFNFHITKEGRKVGFFFLFVVGEQARIGGVWLESSSVEMWSIAFQLAQDVALKHTKASELIARCAMKMSAEGAGNSGMRLRDSIPVVFSRKDGVADSIPPLQFHLADSDSLFRGGRLTEFLT